MKESQTVMEVVTDSREAHDIVGTLLKEVCNSLNKAMAAGMPAEAAAQALDGFSKDLHSAPPGSRGQISLYSGGTGKHITGRELPPEVVKAAVEAHKSESNEEAGPDLQVLQKALDDLFSEPDIVEAPPPGSTMH